MAYLDTYTTPLTAATAAHLLRRATFGPTQQEIADFTGKTASQAVDILISNSARRADPAEPVEMDETRADAGQPFSNYAFSEGRNPIYYQYVKFWWLGLMAEQTGYPSILEKMTAFWQNHFVVTYASVLDHRFIYRYLKLLRSNALGNFKEFAISISKDPGMLIFQNGNENVKGKPNENFARELQELFVVGQKDFNGYYNYSEADVKAVARVLTGWQASNRMVEGSSNVGTTFSSDRHDSDDKLFSSKYNNRTIKGLSGADAGDRELNDLISMLIQHPESSKFICRKLYRWFINTNVTSEIENNVIRPLADFFASPSNNFAIAPVIRKLLESQIFYDNRNIGSMIKSPAELVIGSVRLFNQSVPSYTTDYAAFYRFANFLGTSMDMLQLNFLNQPSVFGSLPYYQTGFSKNWINESSIGLRAGRTDALVNPSVYIKPGYTLGIDILGILRRIQPNFSDVSGTPSITCEQVLREFSKNTFVFDLSQSQKDFLIDSIMMMKSSPRTTWIREWDAYRAAPNDSARQNTILWRCRALLKYMLRMAEFQIF